MSNAIQFLESMGGKPLSASDYAATVAHLNIEETHRQALLDRNHSALNDLLGGRERLMCVVFSPDEEEQPDGDEPPEETPPELE